MSLSKKEFSAYIRQFQFRELFIDMGWNNDRTTQPITVDNYTFTVHTVAEKSGFRMLVCQPNADGLIPDSNIRKKIENKVSKLFYEHLIIFVDANKQEQIWQLVVRQTGKPTKLTETRYHISQNPELLYQRASGIFFEMAEEESITIVDVKKRMNENFHANAEKITKKFYEGFKKEHTSFLAFIKGIDDTANKEWYASLMLNRLMFCYFIQKKGFLDNDKNYLREKLKNCADKKGKNKFYSFYRDFLLVLFHQGLNDAKQTPEVKCEIGQIPYLNGGLFDEHELEKMYQKIDIEDKAFERIFDFFDQFEWHLDTRVSASGKDINPDVIGYIFEKYINAKAEMGAYYTKEDITEYIGKNCIIPFLFDETNRHYSKYFAPNSEIWKMLRQSGDAYIYDAVKYGISNEEDNDLWSDLPQEVQDGLDSNQPDLIEKRKAWNKPASSDIALPTEIYREVIDRRKRYAEVKSKIANGEICSINDFITYNLNIRQFAIDVIENTTDADFLRQFYKALVCMTLLDPTCGSGAFLFAALNILEELYEACLLRMRNFTEDEDRLNQAEKASFTHKHTFFRDTLAETQNEHHPNLQYFIYKTIILRNLYGVDIMKEAVEIAKLRLFLKLVATVEVDFRKPNMGLEPLPDIDFNIRAGNTLVGFAKEKELERSLVEDMMGALVKTEIEEKCEIVALAFKRYKDIQLTDGSDYLDFKTAKDDLNSRLKELNHELNLLLHKQASGIPFKKWLESYQPFHWFAEFYEIINGKSGFDVIIGNPPYVEYSQVIKSYKVKDYSTLDCGNLHAFCLEKSIQIKQSNGYIGLIVPLAIISTPRMESAITLLKKTSDAYFSNYECRPAKLFDGADVRLSIVILCPIKKVKFHFHSTKLIKFSSSERDVLFQNISYTDLSKTIFDYSLIPKMSNGIEINIYNKLYSAKKRISNFISENSTIHCIYYSYGFRYWAKILDKPTYFQSDNASKSTGEKELYMFSKTDIPLIGLALSSTLFYWFYVATSDAHNFTKHIIYSFPIDDFNDDQQNELFMKYQMELEENSIVKIANYKTTGTISFREYYVRKSKPTIDEIDKVLAQHYGFTDEELDFIINYDIKYRMGKELEEED